ncbi:MAG: ABC transporter substrate-binding protein [Candidatus Methanoplasma sp.]|jgi:ABC-type Fe3+-hydroxamate transport system substrate-binding protein|nr:ABC transporter substrate-binding protein [Candidatus Methanoplasma sp.]
MNQQKASMMSVLIVISLIAVAGSGIAAIAVAHGAEPVEEARATIKDMRGRDVPLPDKIESVLAIKSCSLELVSFFAALDLVKYLDVNESFDDDDRTHTFVNKEKLRDLPRVDPSDAEGVILAAPDIIISSTVSVSKLDEDQERYGIPVFAINADLEFGEEFDRQLRAVGALFGERERAEELVASINGFISDVRVGKVAPSSDTPARGFVTAYACGMSFYGAGGFLKTSGDYLPFTYSFVQNISPSSVAGVGKQPYNIDIEQVIGGNPRYIFIDGSGLDETLKFMRDNERVMGLSAVATGDVYSVMVYKSWGTNWVNQMINVYYVAHVVNGAKLLWDFEDKANEVIQAFYPSTSVTYADLAAAQSGGGCAKVGV